MVAYLLLVYKIIQSQCINKCMYLFKLCLLVKQVITDVCVCVCLRMMLEMEPAVNWGRYDSPHFHPLFHSGTVTFVHK